MDYEYGLKTLKRLDTLPIGTWYPFESKNHVPAELLEVVKLRIDLSGDFILSNDHKMFKRIPVPPKEQNNNYSGEITYTIEYKEQDYELNEVEKNLPIPIFKSYSKKDYDRLTSSVNK